MDNFSTGVKKQTILLHWTTVPYGDTAYPYAFPESGDVKIIYVYHDPLFSTFSIVTREKNQDKITTESIPIDLSFNKGRLLTIQSFNLDKRHPNLWTSEQINMVFADTEVGVGLTQEETNKLDNVDKHRLLHLVIKRLALSEGKAEEMINNTVDHLLSKIPSIDPLVLETLVIWVYEILLDRDV